MAALQASAVTALSPLRGHRDTVNCLEHSASASLLASASDDGTARLWDVRTGRAVRCIDGFGRAPVQLVAWGPDSMLWAAAGRDVYAFDLRGASGGGLILRDSCLRMSDVCGGGDDGSDEVSSIQVRGGTNPKGMVAVADDAGIVHLLTVDAPSIQPAPAASGVAGEALGGGKEEGGASLAAPAASTASPGWRLERGLRLRAASTVCTAAAFHPQAPDCVVTGALDGSVAAWNLSQALLDAKPPTASRKKKKKDKGKNKKKNSNKSSNKTNEAASDGAPEKQPQPQQDNEEDGKMDESEVEAALFPPPVWRVDRVPTVEEACGGVETAAQSFNPPLVQALAWHPSGSFFAVGLGDASLALYDFTFNLAPQQQQQQQRQNGDDDEAAATGASSNHKEDDATKIQQGEEEDDEFLPTGPLPPLGTSHHPPGLRLRCVGGHSAAVGAVHFTGFDPQLLLSAGNDSIVALWRDFEPSQEASGGTGGGGNRRGGGGRGGGGGGGGGGGSGSGRSRGGAAEIREPAARMTHQRKMNWLASETTDRRFFIADLSNDISVRQLAIA